MSASRPVRIGEIAARAGVSTRTLRYYEQLGLLSPSNRSPGGARRYTDDDVARLLRIRELQELMGFDLEEIRTIVHSEDRLAQLRAEFAGGDSPDRRREIVREAIQINDRLRAQVVEKLARTNAFLAELEAKARRYRAVLRRERAERQAGHRTSRRPRGLRPARPGAMVDA